MTQSTSTVPKFEVDESRRENLHNATDVIRYERPDHLKGWSFRPTIRVTPGTDLSELMDQDYDDCVDDGGSSPL